MKLFVFCAYANLALALNILLSTPDSWVSKNVRHLKAALEAQNHTVVAVAPLYDNMGSQKLANVDSDDSVTVDADASSGSSGPVLKRLVGSSDAIADGGDFGHLLPVHQIYYKNIRAMNKVVRRPRNVVHKSDEEEQTGAVTVAYDAFGQDPLDRSFWYVDSLPISALLIAMDIILPKYHPGFTPDLVILGPQEGVSYTPQTASDYHESIQAMAAITASQNMSTIAVSSEDSHHIYYQDEHFFNAQQQKLKRFKKNVFARNIRFTNRKIIDLVQRLEAAGSSGARLLPPQVALNVIFPSINHESSHCATSSNLKAKLNPAFKQVVFLSTLPATMVPKTLPKFELVDDGLYKQGLLRLAGNQKRSDDEDEIVGTVTDDNQEPDDDHERTTFVDKKSYYYIETLRNYAKHPLSAFQSDSISVFQKRNLHHLSDNDDMNSLLNNENELAMLNNCHISIAVNHMKLGFGLGPEVLDVEALMQ